MTARVLRRLVIFAASVTVGALVALGTGAFDHFADPPPEPWPAERLRVPFVIPSDAVVDGEVIDSDAYAVYAAVLAVRNLQGAVFSTTLGEYGRHAFLSADLGAEWQSVVADFNTVNRRTWRVLAREPFVGLWQVATRDQIRIGPVLGLTDVLHWKRLERRGKLEVSAVGFNADHSRAIAFASFYAGGRCGFEGFALLDRRDGRWQLVATDDRDLPGWISMGIC